MEKNVGAGVEQMQHSFIGKEYKSITECLQILIYEKKSHKCDTHLSTNRSEHHVYTHPGYKRLKCFV